jgi:alanine racemase
MALKARVSHVQTVPAGEGVSYGLRRPLERASTVATLPLGYADGVPRRLWERGEVLLGGKRRRFAGMITMDQVMIDCGDDTVRIGDEAVLIGQQGSASIAVNDWARVLDTIGYEVVCGISSRVPRRYLR